MGDKSIDSHFPHSEVSPFFNGGENAYNTEKSGYFEEPQKKTINYCERNGGHKIIKEPEDGEGIMICSECDYHFSRNFAKEGKVQFQKE